MLDMEPSGSTISIIPNNDTVVNAALIIAMTDTLCNEHKVLSEEFAKIFPNGEIELDIDAIDLHEWKAKNYASKLLNADSIEIKRLEKKIASHFDYINVQDYGNFISAMYLWLKDTQNVKRVFIDNDEYLGYSHEFAFIVDSHSKRYSVTMRWQTDKS